MNRYHNATSSEAPTPTLLQVPHAQTPAQTGKDLVEEARVRREHDHGHRGRRVRGRPGHDSASQQASRVRDLREPSAIRMSIPPRRRIRVDHPDGEIRRRPGRCSRRHGGGGAYCRQLLAVICPCPSIFVL